MRIVLAVTALAAALLGCTTPQPDPNRQPAQREYAMRIHYLEIVTHDVDAVCAGYAAAGGLVFGDPDPGLGNARTAALPGGSLVGVRAPLRDSEEPVVRPYWLVDDIESALAAAVTAGGEVAHPPLEIPGHGTFAIYFAGGVQHGLWQR
jgi:predicted enzyme related to lactoylglutathione lyase